MTNKKVKVPIRADLSGLDSSMLQCLPELAKALKIVDRIYYGQMTDGFYPREMTRDELLREIAEQPAEKQRELRDPLTRIVRRGSILAATHSAHPTELRQLGDHLCNAALPCGNEQMGEFLEHWVENMREGKFEENNRKWVELTKGPFELTIGPYENYDDKLLGLKQSYEAILSVVLPAETAKVQKYLSPAADHDKAMSERYGYPIENRQNRMIVVDEILTAGFGSEYSAQAYILPNEASFRRKYGSKQVFLRNVMQAKFEKLSVPIGQRILASSFQSELFKNHFEFVVGHEIAHGFGVKFDVPEFVEIGTPLEEFKADVLGLMFLREYHTGTSSSDLISSLLTFLVDCFRRSLHDPSEAHSIGNLVVLNRCLESGAMQIANNRLILDFGGVWQVLEVLQDELVAIALSRDYTAAKALFDEGVVTPPIQSVLDSLQDLPGDIEPKYDTF